MAVEDDHVHAAQRQSRSVRRGNRPASRISVRAARAKIEFVIDQDQARKFWTGWVRREIGGSAMIQEAAVSAAVNELLLGHDNQAASGAWSARRRLASVRRRYTTRLSTFTTVTLRSSRPAHRWTARRRPNSRLRARSKPTTTGSMRFAGRKSTRRTRLP